MKSHILAPLGFYGHASSSCIVPKKNFVCQHKMIVPVYSNEQSCISSFPSILAFLHYRKFLINNKMHDAVTVHAWFQKFSCPCIQNLYKKGTSCITFSKPQQQHKGMISESPQVFYKTSTLCAPLQK